MQLVTNDIPLEMTNKRLAYIKMGSERKITDVGPDLFTVSPLASRAKPDKSNRVVDLKSRTCSCGQWQQMGFPCLHAYGVLFNLEMERDIQFIYSKNHYSEIKTAFSHFHKPVDVSNVSADGITTLAPVSKKRGRPRVKRVRSRGEYSRVGNKKCGKCGKNGHYATTCSGPIEVQNKRQTTCSLCKQKGHNRQTCSNRIVESSQSNNMEIE